MNSTFHWTTWTGPTDGSIPELNPNIEPCWKAKVGNAWWEGEIVGGGGVGYITVGKKKIRAVELDSGKTLWEADDIRHENHIYIVPGFGVGFASDVECSFGNGTRFFDLRDGNVLSESRYSIASRGIGPFVNGNLLTGGYLIINLETLEPFADAEPDGNYIVHVSKDNVIVEHYTGKTEWILQDFSLKDSKHRRDVSDLDGDIVGSHGDALLFLRRDGLLSALSATEFGSLWTSSYAFNGARLSLDGKQVFAIGTDHGKTVECFNIVSTGIESLWQRKFSDSIGEHTSLLTSTHIWFPIKDGNGWKVLALDRKTGEEAQSLAFQHEPSYMAVLDDKLFIRESSKTLHCFK